MSEETTTPTPAEQAPVASKPERDAPKSAARANNGDDSKAVFQKEGRQRSKRRKKASYLTLNKIYHVDYKDISLLKRFVNEQGKILGARQTGATAKQQRMITRAVRRAREMALIPFVSLDTGGNERGGYNRERGPRKYSGPPRENREPATETAAE